MNRFELRSEGFAGSLGIMGLDGTDTAFGVGFVSSLRGGVGGATGTYTAASLAVDIATSLADLEDFFWW